MAPSLSLKDRISSPLEAGTSIADGHYLPAYLTPALEYASKRLLRKGVSVTLLVVRRDYQLPTSPLTSPCSPAFPPPPASPALCSFAGPSTTSTPLRSPFGLKQFVRSYSSTNEAPIRERILFAPLDQFRNGCASPAVSEASVASGSTASTASSTSTAESTFSRRLRWPNSPIPMTPATPFSTVSSSALTSSTDTGSAVSGAVFPGHAGQFAIKLVHIGSTGAREERILAQTIEKAAKKFKLGAEWLSQPVLPAALDLPTDVVHRSMVQYETLFAGENLTLLSLDHLYTFRTALQSYARTRASPRLEDAVDELRRLFLANGRKKLLKSALLAAYRWLDPISDSALSDVCRMYGRAYGGLDLESGVENDVDSWPIQNKSVPTEPKDRTTSATPSPQYSEHDPLRQHPYKQTRFQPPPQPREQEQNSSIIMRNDTPVFERPHHTQTPPPEASLEDKEFLFDPRLDDYDFEDDDDDLRDVLPEDLVAELKELDEIERWYRQVQINVDSTCSTPIPIELPPPSPAAVVAVPPSRVDVLPPPPPPPPIMHIGLSTNTPAAVVVSDSEVEESDVEQTDNEGDNDDEDSDVIHSESEFEELEERRATPRLAAPPVVVVPPLPIAASAAGGGASNRPLIPMMNLRLQTTFEPKPKARRRSPTKNVDAHRRGMLVPTPPPLSPLSRNPLLTQNPLAQHPVTAVVQRFDDHEEEEDEEEEDLTARPKSAIVVSHPLAQYWPQNNTNNNSPVAQHSQFQWTTAAIAAATGLHSIDTIMTGGSANNTTDGSSRNSGSSSHYHHRIQTLRAEDRRVGPITPNGYDDISPITRGEWGFFMNGGEWGSGSRKAAVEMC